jgi:hypothetical protein
MKCKYCEKEILNSETELHQEPQKDREGNIKTSKKGILYNNYHRSCFEFKEKEKLGFNNLYDYILEKYFIKMLPTSLIKSIRELRQHYDFELILECLQNLENNLMTNIDRINNGTGFNSDYQKGNYIMSALRNSIDNFYSKRLKQDNDKKNVSQNDEFDFIDNTVIRKSGTIENYDILD